MVLPDNQVGSPKSVLDDKDLEYSSNDADFNLDLYLYDEEDNGNIVVVPQTPSEEVRTRIYNIEIPPSLIRGIGEDMIWDKIGTPLSPNHTEREYSVCCENTINMINSIKDLREENRDMFSSIKEAIKLMLFVATNMSCVVENNTRKEESKDNIKEYKPSIERPTSCLFDLIKGGEGKQSKKTLTPSSVRWSSGKQSKKMLMIGKNPAITEAKTYSIHGSRKAIFETYVKSKDLDLWHVITYDDFPPIQNNPETKKDEIVQFDKQNDDLKKKLAKNYEAKMVIYNALPLKDNKIDLLVQQYEQFTIPEEESIDNAFARFNTIITSLKALDEGFSSKNYVRKFLRALHPKWRAKVTAIEESKDLTSLSLDELIES
ncbi:hypothetical protein Tco_1136205 [Tanacetum coccineum]